MKTKLSLLTCLLAFAVFTSCQEKKGNQELYDEVMDIHDEVMPKMDDLHRYKKTFQSELTNNATITEARKTQLETIIVKLDSAGEGMMVWMREFNPIPDSEGEDKAKQYLENEKKKVTKVKEDMLKALDEAKKLTGS
jgi:hypothetical protein